MTEAKIFDEIFKKLKGNLQKKKEGKVTSIGFPFERFSNKFPGWEKSTQTIITANSGVGKTKLAKFLAVTNTYNFIKKHPEIKPKVFYFALEESIEYFWLGIISNMLYEKYDLDYSPNQLKSLGSFTIPDDVLEKVAECKEIVEDMQNYIEVIDHVFNPFGIYKVVADYFSNPEIGYEEYETKTAEKVSKKYIFKDENFWPFVIIDHISLITPEKGETLWDAIGRFSKQYCLKMFTKKYQCTTIIVQQQESAKEKKEYHQGISIEEKLEPTLDGLANNKETQRECNLVIGLFAPERYNISTHRGYNIRELRNKYRSMIILKDRDNGLINHYVPLYFNGAVNEFNELPPAAEIDYSRYKK